MNAPERQSYLKVYARLSRFRRLNYQAKIMLMAFIGTHVPLIALAVWFTFQNTHDWDVLLRVLAIALAATLAGTAATLLVLHHLLRPVTLTSKALRLFRDKRERMPLPTRYTDEVGTLMADAHQTLHQLDRTLDALEFIDQTTGLPNRKRFTQHVQERIARGQPFAVAVVRFANLIRIAETMDAERGEAAARTLVQRLSSQGEFDDQLSRIGPSKFGCILNLSGDHKTWAATATQLRTRLQQCGAELSLGEVSFAPQLQGGLAVFPEDGKEAEALIDSAINAASLAQGEAPVMLHSVKARSEAMAQLKLEQDLRRALERDEFSLHYQPVFDLNVGRAVGAEALLRWHHPERGMVPPGAFIGAAETSGLIEPLGLWVMRQACAQLGQWQRQGLPEMRMAINVSARQFLNPDLTTHLREAIDAAGISPAQLEIELTETVAMVDHTHTRRVFTALRDEGVGIAIDDFGTGYASMSYLRKLPFDKLKIDREFVNDVHRTRQSQAICSALIELARGLDLRVLAEGAEHESEVHYLAQHGCDLFQGFYFSRPVPAGQFEHALSIPDGLFSHSDAPLSRPAQMTLH